MILYIEEDIFDHPKSVEIRSSFSKATVIPISSYTELFNRKNQNFRLQKENPALILAQKRGAFSHEVPANYGLGKRINRYFSHILNCPYDCQYCFLQGMYRSANLVLFVNYDEFQKDLLKQCHPYDTTYYSGYDGDSLAYESKTGFLEAFYPFAASNPQFDLEIRTKCSSITFFKDKEPIPNLIIAFSLSPEMIAEKWEWKAPKLKHRLHAIKKLSAMGWRIGFRFDPIIAVQNHIELYKELFNEAAQNCSNPHSITLGSFRLPRPFVKEFRRMDPKHPLLPLLPVQTESSLFSSAQSLEVLYEHLTTLFDSQIIFTAENISCQNSSSPAPALA